MNLQQIENRIKRIESNILDQKQENEQDPCELNFQYMRDLVTRLDNLLNARSSILEGLN